MDAGLQRGKHEFGVPPVGRRHVDGIHLPRSEHLIKLLVRVGMRNTVLLAHFAGFFGVAGHERSDFGIARVGDAGHHRLLRDIAETDNRITDLLFGTQSECR